MPAEMELEIEKIVGGGERSPHLAMVDWAERSISKVILGQTMSAEAKGSGLGSGNADLHREVRHDILVSDTREIAGTITRDLLYPLIALNRGNIDGLRRCPRFVFNTAQPEDITKYADALPKLVGVGFRIPRPWAHTKLGVPEPTEDEEVLTVAAPANVLTSELRPAGKKTPVDKAALAALSAEADTVIPDQVAIDAALDALPPEALQAQMDQMIGALLAELEQAGGYEAAMAVLAGKFPALDAGRLESMLAKAMFAAEVWGAAHA